MNCHQGATQTAPPCDGEAEQIIQKSKMPQKGLLRVGGLSIAHQASLYLTVGVSQVHLLIG